MAYDLVIFDCDGVLVDSEPRSNAALAAVLTAHGLPMTAEDSTAERPGTTARSSTTAPVRRWSS